MTLHKKQLIFVCGDPLLNTNWIYQVALAAFLKLTLLYLLEGVISIKK